MVSSFPAIICKFDVSSVQLQWRQWVSPISNPICSVSHLLFSKAEARKLTQLLWPLPAVAELQFHWNAQFIHEKSGMGSLLWISLLFPLMIQSSAWSLSQGHTLGQPHRAGSWSWPNLHTWGTAALPRLSHGACATESQLLDLYFQHEFQC